MQLQALVRPASVLEIGGTSEDPLGSWYGTVKATGQDEEWPTWQDRPMVGVCQLNLDDAPHVPPVLGDLMLLAVFMAERNGRPEPPLETPHGAGWLVRGYPATQELVPAEGPIAPGVRPFPGRWVAVDADLPDWEDAADHLEEGSEGWEEYYEITDGAADGVKIGGWPALIQTGLPWSVDGGGAQHALQLASDPKTGINWVDGGTVYFARDAAHPPDAQWQAETQFY